MKFAFIAKHRHVWPMSWLCEALDVSRSGFHAWLRRGPSARETADEGLIVKIRSSFVGSARTYGPRRVWRDVLAEGLSCGPHKVERLMRMNALRARPRRRGLPKDDGKIAVCRSQPSRSAIRRRAAEPEVDRGLHVYPDGRGLALCRGRDRPLFAKAPSDHR
jgi:transposase InsO family protein